MAREQKLQEINAKKGNHFDLPFQHFKAGATLIAAQIENSVSEESSLNFLQKGDSSLVVFRLQKHTGDVKAYHYAPVFMTEEQSNSLNQPRIFGNLVESSFNNFTKKVKITKGDIVIAGSDGLFDNVSLGLLTYLVNSLLT